jgi:type II secretory pathway pseudopilin PulG
MFDRRKNFKAQNNLDNLATQKGFTLIEAIVATALFVFVVISVINVYLYTVKANRRADVLRTASESSRFISEFLTKEIRNGQVDYFGPAQAPCSTTSTSGSNLAILNVDGDHECFYLSGTNLLVAKNAGGQLLSPVQLNDARVKVLNLYFYVAPGFNPYTSGSRTEPQVTMIGQIQVTSGSQDTITLPMQTTISIPRYDIQPGP